MVTLLPLELGKRLFENTERFCEIPGSRDFCHHKNHKVNPPSEHKSDINHPKNSFCRELSEHLRSCSSSPHFMIFPILYVDDKNKRKFIESRLIKQFRPPLNGDGTRQ